jgi:integrase
MTVTVRGRGSIQRRRLANGKVVFDLIFVEEEDGQRKQRWLRGYQTRQEAEDRRAEVVVDSKRGAYTRPTDIAVGQYLDRWLNGHRPSIRPSTWTSYRMNIDRHIAPALGRVLLRDLGATAINEFYSGLLTGGRINGKGGLSARTVRYIHSILRRALKDAADEDLIVRNPADRAKPPAAKATRAPKARTWNAEQTQTFLAAVQDDPLYPAFLLLATTGMRRGEVCGLEWRDLDLDGGRIAIDRARIAVRHEVMVSQTKSGRGRSVDLDPETIRVLRQHRREQLEKGMAQGAAPSDGDLVFPGLHPDHLSKVFDRRVRDAALPRIRLHDLRHGWATLALRDGIHPKVVSERLGHATVAFTLDIYSAVMPGLQRQAAESIAAKIILAH